MGFNFRNFWEGKKQDKYTDTFEGQAYRANIDALASRVTDYENKYNNWETPDFLRFGATERSAMENRFRQVANQEYGRTLWDLQNQMAVSGQSLGSRLSTTARVGAGFARKAADQVMQNLVEVDKYSRTLGQQNYNLREDMGDKAFRARGALGDMWNQYGQNAMAQPGGRKGGYGEVIMGAAVDAGLAALTGGASAGFKVAGMGMNKDQSYSPAGFGPSGGGELVGTRQQQLGFWDSAKHYGNQVGNFLGFWNKGEDNGLQNPGDWAVVGDNSQGGGRNFEIVIKNPDGSVRVIPHDEAVQIMNNRKKRGPVVRRDEMRRRVARNIHLAAADAEAQTDFMGRF